MSEQELNSYRFLSGEEPTDEMLAAIMSEANKAAIQKAAKAQQEFEADYERQYQLALKKWGAKIAAAQNGHQ